MKTLIITTPNNPAYSGETFGVKFELGEAMVNDLSRPNKYGHDLDTTTNPPTRNLDVLARKFIGQLDGYVVRVIDDTPQPGFAVNTDPTSDAIQTVAPVRTLADFKKEGAK